MIAQLRKMFSKISMNICATISFMLLANLFTFSDYVGLCKEQLRNMQHMTSNAEHFKALSRKH